ncbi:alpha/beta fold hydrolase [Allosphingosinicella flava]|uniref:alpha/beta fold hydrolase n=1 Tax=Allosphingosinicella flava TaxID=2771430 RepID=UPI001CF7C9CF|nr:alpha/beta hydrolase [Sphingosinicella flava]
MRGSLLFLGGRGDFIEKYLEAMHHWHMRGWHITSFDWRGQGASRKDGGPSPDAGFDPLLHDLAVFSQEWIAAHPGPHVAVGHSMGGHLLLRALAEASPPFAAAVLVAPMIGINTGLLPGWLSARLARFFQKIGRGSFPVARDYQAAIEGKAARQNRLTSSADRYADEKWWHGRQPGYDLGIPTWDWVAAAYRSMAASTPGALKAVRIPLLILATDRDRLVDTRAIREAARLLPNAELALFDSAHEILREDDPVRLAAMHRIDAFLDRHAAS